MKEIEKLRNILNKNNIELLELIDDEDYTSFHMAKEYFLDIFELRLEISLEMGTLIKGLENSLKTITNSKHNKIVSHSIYNGNILIYTNEEISEILGFIDFR